MELPFMFILNKYLSGLYLIQKDIYSNEITHFVKKVYIFTIK